jgi:hypothetical protein
MVPAEAAVPASSDSAIAAAPQIFESKFMVWFSFVPRNLSMSVPLRSCLSIAG